MSGFDRSRWTSLSLYPSGTKSGMAWAYHSGLPVNAYLDDERW